MLARDLIGAVRDLDQARLDPVLDFLGLLDGSGATATVRLPAGLVADPGGWLGRTLAGQGLDPDRVASLVDAVRELAGLPAAAHGTLPLPLGAALTAGPGAGGGLAVTLAVTDGRRRPARGVQRRADHPLRRRAAGASLSRRPSGRQAGRRRCSSA